jgi:hypothetical protein
MTGDGMDLRIQGAIKPPGIAGTVSGQEMQMKFSAQLQGNQLFFKLIEPDEYGQPDYDEAETLILIKQMSIASTAPVPSLDKS